MGKITATFNQDSKRYHRSIIDEGQGIAGNIPKGEDVPDEITIALRTSGEVPRGRSNGIKELPLLSWQTVGGWGLGDG